MSGDDPGEMLISYALTVELDQRDPEVADLIESLRSSGSRDRRRELNRDLAAALERDSMIIFLVHRRPGIPRHVHIVAPTVRGIVDPRTGLMNPMRQRLHEIWIDAGD